jgi:acyl dehydratase
MSSERKVTCAEMKTRIGEELGVTGWFEVTQALIDQFGASTCDPDWIHVDPERAARETPFGGSIAFGFWTLSMLTHFSHQVGMWPSDAAYALNYGLERVRWISPVPVGARIRNRCRLIGFDERDPGRFMIRTANQVEIEGAERPALVADWLGLFLTEAAARTGAPAGPDDDWRA